MDESNRARLIADALFAAAAFVWLVVLAGYLRHEYQPSITSARAFYRLSHEPRGTRGPQPRQA